MAGRIPQRFIDDLLARVDIVSVIEPFLALRKTGINYQALCPFHQEKTPSFSISPSKQFYHCFGCGASGNAISFMMDHQHMNFVEAIETLASQIGMPMPREMEQDPSTPNYQPLYDVMEKLSEFYQTCLRNNPHATDYLKNRGLTGKIAKQFEIGYAPSGWNNLLEHFGEDTKSHLVQSGMLIKKDDHSHYDRFRDRIMFPIRDRRGRVIAFGGRVLGDDVPKYLNSPETPIFHKGHELYGLYEAKKTRLDRLLLVEGYMDVVALAQHDIPYAVATLGTATSAHHIEQLFRVTPEVVFCFDGDDAGIAAAWRALEILMPLLQNEWSVKFILLPKDEDPDSFVRKEGKQKFETCVVNAQPLSEFFFDHLQQKVNMCHLDGRARFVSLALPYIKKIPNEISREMFLAQLSQLAHIDANTLQNYMPTTNTTVKPLTHPTRSRLKTTISPMRMVITLLLQHSQLIEHIEAEPSLPKTPGADLLTELIALIRTKNDWSTGSLLEHWRDRPEFSRLSQLATHDHMIPPEGLVLELCAALRRLQKQIIEHQIEALMKQASTATLTDDGKRLLQNLLKQKQDY